MDNLIAELEQIREQLRNALDSAEQAAARETLVAIEERAFEIGESSSGSWLAGQENLYYIDFKSPPPGKEFNQLAATLHGYTDGWSSHTDVDIESRVVERVHIADLKTSINVANECARVFTNNVEHVKSIIQLTNREADTYLDNALSEMQNLRMPTKYDIIKNLAPNAAVGDAFTLAKGPQSPPHIRVFAKYAATRHGIDLVEALEKLVRNLIGHLNRIQIVSGEITTVNHRIFIGHGKSPVWRELKDFIQDRLGLEWDEFDRIPAAGMSITERLTDMLDNATFAFLILTAEDDQSDGSKQARMNVIHEAGLFQGKLGFDKAIILLEDDCTEFSNIHGLVQIRFAKDNISAKFEELRRVLEDRDILSP